MKLNNFGNLAQHLDGSQDSQIELTLASASLLSLSGSALVETHATAEHETHQEGTLLSSEHIDNMIVALGRARIMALLAQTSTSFMSHMAVSTAATAIADGDTTLASEVSRIALGSTSAGGTALTMRATWGAGDANGNTIASAGIFDDPTAGTMFSGFVLSSTIAKTSSISLTITWTWAIT